MSAASPDGSGAWFFEDITRTGVLPPHVSVLDAASAVLCTLSQRLSGGEARDFAGSLSGSVQALLRPCVLHRDERGQTFDRAGYLARVAEHLRCSPQEAETIARAVFSSLQAHMPSSEVDDVESHLPVDLKPLWRVH